MTSPDVETVNADSSEKKSTNEKSEKYYLKPDDLNIDEKYYKPDLEISDRFQAYSAELLRLSLAGVAAVGFFYEKLGALLKFDRLAVGNLTVKDMLIWSLIFLAVASALALAHRYLSSDGMAYHLAYIRFELAAKKEKRNCKRKDDLALKATSNREWRTDFFKACEILLGASALALGIGAFCLVIGFACGL